MATMLSLTASPGFRPDCDTSKLGIPIAGTGFAITMAVGVGRSRYGTGPGTGKPLIVNPLTVAVGEVGFGLTCQALEPLRRIRTCTARRLPTTVGAGMPFGARSSSWTCTLEKVSVLPA